MADRASGREGNDGGGDSNTLGRRDYRPTPGRTSATSFLCFLLSEFCDPRIFRLGGLGLAEIELGAVGQRDGRHTGSLRLLDKLADAWLARLAGLARLGQVREVFFLRLLLQVRKKVVLKCAP